MTVLLVAGHAPALAAYALVMARVVGRLRDTLAVPPYRAPAEDGGSNRSEMETSAT